MTFRLDGKVALVTGGSRGIGRACAVALGGAGAYVVVNYASNEAAAAEALGAVRGKGGDGEIRRFDVADAGAVDAAVKEIVAARGRLDVVVTSAGLSIDALVLRLKDQDLQRLFDVNVRGSLHVARAALRTMLRARTGRVVFMTSVVGETGNAGQAAYSITKGGVVSLAKSLAREYASRGITVNAVSPGFIDTDMTAALPDEARKAMVAQTPLGRTGRPEEVAAVALFLASDEASYVTGQVVRVNGGLYM